MTVETRAADETAIRAEAIRFGRYLIGSHPSAIVAARYAQAMASGRFEVVGRDRRTLDFLARHPRLIGMVDGGLALRRPHSAVRLRLLAMAAILEATPEHAGDYLPKGRSPVYIFYVALVAARAGIRGAIGAVLVTWI